MPVSALVITLAEDDAEATLSALADHPCLALGARAGRRVAAALDTPDEATNKQAWRWLQGQSGVSFVDLLFVHFDPDGAAGSGST